MCGRSTYSWVFAICRPRTEKNSTATAVAIAQTAAAMPMWTKLRAVGAQYRSDGPRNLFLRRSRARCRRWGRRRSTRRTATPGGQPTWSWCDGLGVVPSDGSSRSPPTGNSTDTRFPTPSQDRIGTRRWESSPQAVRVFEPERHGRRRNKGRQSDDHDQRQVLHQQHTPERNPVAQRVCTRRWSVPSRLVVVTSARMNDEK